MTATSKHDTTLDEPDVEVEAAGREPAELTADGESTVEAAAESAIDDKATAAEPAAEVAVAGTAGRAGARSASAGRKPTESGTAEPEAAVPAITREATAEPAAEPEAAGGTAAAGPAAAKTKSATTKAEPEADSDGAELSEASDSVETGGPLTGRTGRSSGQRLLNSRLAMLALAVVVALVAAGGVFAWLQINELKQRAAAPEQARQAAMRFATDLGTYDYRDPAGNFRLVAEQSTDNFAGQLKQITEAMTPLLTQTKATSKGSVAAAGVASLDGNRAVVVLFLDQTIENTNTKQPRVDRSRMRLTLVNEGGVWKLDHVEAR